MERCTQETPSISLHNFPEGMAMFLGSIKMRFKKHEKYKITGSMHSDKLFLYVLSDDLHHQHIDINLCLLDCTSQGMLVGVNLALAIALHYILEGLMSQRERVSESFHKSIKGALVVFYRF